MAARVSSGDSFCTFTFLDCFSARNHDQLQTEIDTDQGKDNSWLSSGFPTDLGKDGTIERAATPYDQQPHLVEPMKLTVYEQLPCTPLSAQYDITPRPFFSRAMTASRASSRASFFSLKRIVSRQSISISKPMPYAPPANDLPLRRGRHYRPLELSIYMDHHRLSDLPEFDRFSFTDFGHLKNLGAILSRPQSVVFPPARETQPFLSDEAHKPASMFEIGSFPTGRPPTSYSIVSDLRPQTSYSVLSASRPPSEYDALHSHPVSCASLPGLTLSTQNIKQEKPVAILTPMAEEFPSETTVVTVDGTVLTFPADSVRAEPTVVNIPLPPIDLAAPAPVVSRGSYHARGSSKSLDDASTISSGRARHGHKRSLSQWLASRARSSSTSTVATMSTTRSFAEHRRKRSQFYQLGQQAQVPATSQPRPLMLVGENRTVSSDPYHQRTTTVSTLASTVDTDVLSDEYHTARTSEDRQVHSSAADIRARPVSTPRRVISPSGRQITAPTVKEFGLASPVRGQVYIVNNDDDSHALPYLDEIGGRMHTAGVGVAF